MHEDPRKNRSEKATEVSETTDIAPSREAQWLDVVSHPAAPLPPQMAPLTVVEEIPAEETVADADPSQALPLLRILAIVALTLIFLLGWQGTAGDSSEMSPIRNAGNLELTPAPSPAQG